MTKAPTVNTLPVPFVGQEGVTANVYRNDCAIACLCMVMVWAKVKPLTVNALAALSSLRFSDIGVGAEEIAMLAVSCGVSMYVRRGITLAAIEYELKQARPCIVAVNEWKIPNRPGQPAGDGSHDIVLIGYDRNTFTAHDPAGRAAMPIATADLTAAMAPRGDTAILVAAVDAPPVTRPAARAGTATANLNVREKPSTTSRIITTLKKETRIPVIEDAPGWLRIAEGNKFAGGYVSAQWVAF